MNKDLTVGKPERVLWRYCIPLLGSVIFQQLYNIADSLVAGKYVGKNALAAVGNSYEITLIYMAFAFGCNMGSSVIAAQFFGAKNYRKMKTTVYTTFIYSAVLCLILTLTGLFAGGALLHLIHTPADIFADSKLYLDVYTGGLVFLFFYNIATGIFSALGDSKTPFIFLAFSSVSNVFVDILFVKSFHMGVAGVAWATFIAQGISAVLALVTLLVRLQKFAGKERVPLFDRKLFVQILAIAVPSILQQSVLSVGNLFVQDIVNRYGSAVVAGYSGAIKLNTFAINIFMTLGSCLSSYTAQNIGAGKQERIPMGFRTGLKLSELTALPFVVLYFGLGQQMMGLFLNAESSAAIHAGVMFLRIVSPWYFMIVVKLMTDGIIRGSGAMIYFVIATIPDLILRIGFALMLSPRFGSTGIWMAWPFGWIAATVLTIIFYRKVKNGYGMRNAAGQK